MAAHSFFQSTTIQHNIIDGKEEGKEKHVTIKNGKGTKTVKQIKNGKTISNTTVPLTNNEIKKAQNNIFMPKFWKNCEPGNNCAIQNKNNNNNTKKNKNNNKNNNHNNNNNKNKNKNNNNASKNQTKKRRRH
jgi:hypothetical protein